MSLQRGVFIALSQLGVSLVQTMHKMSAFTAGPVMMNLLAGWWIVWSLYLLSSVLLEFQNKQQSISSVKIIRLSGDDINKPTANV